MINSKIDLKKYLCKDKEMLGINRRKPKIFGDEIWKFEIILRKYEYFNNCCNFINFPFKLYYKFRHHYLSLKLGFDIPINVFEEGLNIHHYGNIVVNKNAKVGKNCCLQQGVNIGQNYGGGNVPILGDDIYIGPGAKIFGKIRIANNVVIGANAVVNKSILEENVACAGCPAKIIGKRKKYEI